jgi:hypothetical protein
VIFLSGGWLTIPLRIALMTNHQTARTKLPILPQLCKVIPSHLTANLAKKHGINPRETN